MRPTDSAIRVIACAALLFAAGTSRTEAQLSWESPQMLGPHAPAGFSILVVDYGLDPNPDLGGSVIWRTAAAGSGFGIHASVAQGVGDRLNMASGVDIARPLVAASREFPFDLMWTAGVGGSWGESIEAAVPIGITLGTTVSSTRVRFDPYASARGVLEGRTGGSAIGEGVSFALVIDIGADIFIGRSRTFALRTAASLGDRHAAAIGLHVSPRRNTAAASRALPSRQ